MGINLRQLCDNLLNMNWTRLKNMKCPQCQGDLNEKLVAFYACAKGCGFNISKLKFEEIIVSLYRKQAGHRISEDNSEALNNLNHVGLTEDFSDSPFLNV